MKLLAYQDLNSKYQLGLSKEYCVKGLNEDKKLKYIDITCSMTKTYCTKKLLLLHTKMQQHSLLVQ